MKSFIVLTLGLVLLSFTADAQAPRPFAGDILTGITKFDLQDVQQSEFLTNAGIGVIYRFFRFDPVTATYQYDVAVGMHIFSGYANQEWKFGIVAGVSLLDGWLKIEPGYDFVSKSAIVMVGTSYGVTFPGTL